MRTTIELSDPLFQKAKAFAAVNQTTLKNLVEQGLRLVLQSPKEKWFKLKDVSVTGKGLNPEFADWKLVSEEIYRGRGS